MDASRGLSSIETPTPRRIVGRGAAGLPGRGESAVGSIRTRFSRCSARPTVDLRPRKIVCSGRAESIHGEVEVSAQIAGRLAEVRVTDGDSVREGDILAVLEGARESEELGTAEANVAVARLRLQQVQAGNGKEEIEQAYNDMMALEARLAYETTNLDSLRRLYQKRALASDELQRKSGHSLDDRESLTHGELRLPGPPYGRRCRRGGDRES